MFCTPFRAMLIRRFVGAITLACTSLTIACSGAGARQQLTVVPTALAISPATVDQPAGRTQQFTATAIFSDSSARDVTAEAIWASSATSIATVSQPGGRGTAIADGDVTISARFNAGETTVTATASLHVTPPVADSIFILPNNPHLELGANQQFTAVVTLSDGTTSDVTQSVSWSSSDESVLRVNTTSGRTGLANTRGPGSATVRASFHGVTSSTAATVARRSPKFLYAGGIAGIEGFSIDSTTGALTPVGSPFSAVGIITSLAATRDRRFLFAADPVLGAILSFEISASGKLNELPNSPLFLSPTSSPISVVAHPTADFLIVTDSDGGEIITFAIAVDGALSAARSSVVVGGAPDLAAITPDGKFFYQPLTDGGSIAQFSFARDGTLASITDKPLDTGRFPRMLTADPSASFVYATIASSAGSPSTSILGYTIDPLSGALSLISAPPFSTGENPLNTAIEPSGRFLYVVNSVQETGSSVTEFTIDPTTGVLTGLPGSPIALPSFPLSVATDPGAQFLYIGFSSGRDGLRTFSIDQNTGALTGISTSEIATRGAIFTLATTY